MTSKEALDRLKFIADKELNTGSKSYKDLQEFWNYKEPLKVITDLVERDTPMQVQIKYSVHKYTYILERQQCPNCSKPIIYSQPNYCGHCGQLLKWRKQND